jgi:hypothetical protein
MNTNNGWLDIASAPKDGTPVLLFARHIYHESSTRVVGAYLHDHGWVAQAYAGQGMAQLVPSHWMELPPFPGTPPASAQDDAKDDYVSGESFTRAWIGLEELPGSMLIGGVGPIPASTSCWITTDAQEAERMKAAGPVLEIFTRRPDAAPAAGDAPQDLLGRLATPLTPYGLLARALRVATGTTLMDMARATGNTPAEISSIEFGRKEPNESWFERAALFFASTSNGIVVPPSALKAAHKSRAASQQGDAA